MKEWKIDINLVFEQFVKITNLFSHFMNHVRTFGWLDIFVSELNRNLINTWERKLNFLIILHLNYILVFILAKIGINDLVDKRFAISAYKGQQGLVCEVFALFHPLEYYFKDSAL